MWKNMADPDRAQMTICHMCCCVCWITNAKNTHTHSEYVLLIALRWQQSLREIASMSYTRKMSALYRSHISHECHIPCPSLTPWYDYNKIFVRVTNDELPHNAIFSNLRIFLSKYVPPQCTFSHDNHIPHRQHNNQDTHNGNVYFIS
jgi:hypothetical protein